MNSDEFLQSLRDDVLTADRRLRARRSRRRGAALVAVASVVVVGVLAVGVLTSNDQASAGVEVTREGEDLVVTLTDLTTEPQEVVDAAKAAGLDVVVDTVPTGPSLAGRFVSADGDEMPSEMRTTATEGSSAFDGFRIPADYTGTLRLHLGRAARPGEKWAAAADVSAWGEPLACQNVFGSPLEEVLADLEAEDPASVRVFILDSGGEIAPSDTAAFADATVLRVLRTQPDEYSVDAVADPSSNPAQSPPPTDDRC